MTKMTPPMSAYDRREAETLLAFAVSVYQDPASSPEDREAARQRIVTPQHTDLSRLSDAELDVALALLRHADGEPAPTDPARDKALALAACEVAGRFVGAWERASGARWATCPCCSGPIELPPAAGAALSGRH